MAVIYIEENNDYEGAKHSSRARIFQEKLNIADVYGFALFFSNLLNDLTKDILDYTIHQQKELIAELQDSLNSGDGLGY